MDWDFNKQNENTERQEREIKITILASEELVGVVRPHMRVITRDWLAAEGAIVRELHDGRRQSKSGTTTERQIKTGGGGSH